MITQSYSNGGKTTLNNGGTLVSGATTCTVTDGTVFPAVSTGVSAFDLIIESEIIRCTNRSGNVLTIARGQEGTSAVSHADGTEVDEIITAQGIKNFGSIVHPSGTQANRPSVGSVGRLWLPTDGNRISQEDGSTWSSWGPLFPFVDPDDSLYSWVNQGSASVVTTNGGIFLSAAAGAGTDQIRARVKTIPAAPYTVTMACIPIFPYPANFNACGLCLRDSGTGKIVTFAVASDSTQITIGVGLSSIKWNSATSFNAFYTLTPTIAANYALLAPYTLGPCLWLQIKDDNTNRMLKISCDGVNFQQLHTVARTDFITPDQIGFFINQQNASFGVGLNVLSFTGG